MEEKDITFSTSVSGGNVIIIVFSLHHPIWHEWNNLPEGTNKLGTE